MSKPYQHLTSAEQTFVGAGVYPPMLAQNDGPGAPVTFVYKASLGSPVAADTNALIAAATSTELPNAATKTYTTANAGTSPVDDAGLPTAASVKMLDGQTYSVFPLDVPRNLTLAATHGSSLVAMTVTVTGFDAWGAKLVETLSISATGTSKTAAGKKAFRWIYSIAITSAGNATTNTLSVGFGNVFGLPYRLGETADVLRVVFGGATDPDATLVAGVSATATATTGDVRGTVSPGGRPASQAIVQQIISGGSAGNLTVSGITTDDRLLSVVRFDEAADTGTDATGNKVQAVDNLASEFTITAADTINNTGGTATTGDTLLVTYQPYTANTPDGSSGLVVWYRIDGSTAAGLAGVAQYAG